MTKSDFNGEINSEKDGAQFLVIPKILQRASIQIHRLESVSHGPMYSHFAEILACATTDPGNKYCLQMPPSKAILKSHPQKRP